MNSIERIELEKRWHEKTGLSLGRRLADIHELGRQSAQDEAEAWRASLSIVADALGVSLEDAPADVGLGNWLAGLVRRPADAVPGTAIDTQKLRRIGKMMSNGDYISCTSGIVGQAAEHIDAQSAEIARLRRPWQPIETAPKDGSEILLYRGPAVFEGSPVPARVTSGAWIEWEEKSSEYHGTTGVYLGEFVQGAGADWMSWDGGFTQDAPPTHWMPLPAGPGAALSGEGN